jgi:hypothetical protein
LARKNCWLRYRTVQREQDRWENEYCLKQVQGQDDDCRLIKRWTKIDSILDILQYRLKLPLSNKFDPEFPLSKFELFELAVFPTCRHHAANNDSIHLYVDCISLVTIDGWGLVAGWLLLRVFTFHPT